MAVLEQSAGRVLVADDDVNVRQMCCEVLRTAGYEVHEAADGAVAADLVNASPFDAIVSDITMPVMGGVDFMRNVRKHDLDIPVVFMTGYPAIDSAVKAVEIGALRYLVKPFPITDLTQSVEQAVRLHRLSLVKREALEKLAESSRLKAGEVALALAFERALGSLRMVYQPIVSWSGRRAFGYEALVRSNEPLLPHPGALFEAAEKLGRLNQIGRAIRAAVAVDAAVMPEPAIPLFVNAHPLDLLDEELYDADAPLSRLAARVVIEITERAELSRIPDIRERIARLRGLGYRIAIDDLGAGYASLTSFAMLEPNVVKIDMALVRDIDRQPINQGLVRTFNTMCASMGQQVIAEGIETAEERDTLIGLGCDLLQGYLFARPDSGFPEPRF